MQTRKLKERAKDNVLRHTISRTLLVILLFFLLEFLFKIPLRLIDNVLIFFLLQPTVVMSIYFIRIKSGEYDDIVQRVVNIQDEKMRNIKSKNQEIRKEFINKKYNIDLISTMRGKNPAFLIRLREKIYIDAIPSVYVDGNKIHTRIVTSKELLCFPKINSYAEKIIFSCGNSLYVIKNPYYCVPSASRIAWQCQGHPFEKKIIIEKDVFPNAHSSVTYPFAMMINGAFHRKCSGTYCPEKKVMTIKISSVEREHCIGHSCTLRFIPDKRININLPKPGVYSVNGEPAMA